MKTLATVSRSERDWRNLAGRFRPESLRRFFNKRFLIRRLERDIPGFRSLDDARKVSALRDWAFAHQTVASRSERLDTVKGHEVYKCHAPDLYRWMGRDRGFLCAGCAFSLKCLYEMFRYRSYTINMGDETGGSDTHVTTLVEIRQNGRNIFSVQDAYFNFTLREPDGALLDYEKLIRQLAAGRHEEIRTEFGVRNELRVVVNRKDESEPAIRHLYGQGFDPASAGRPIRPDTYRMRRTLDLERHFFGLGSLGEWIHTRTGKRNNLYIFLFPFGTSGEPASLALIKEVRRRMPSDEKVGLAP